MSRHSFCVVLEDNMRHKTAKMRELERLHGKPIVQLLKELYADTGSIIATAKHLGISVSTTSNWLARFDIPTRATVNPRDFLFQDDAGDPL